MGRGLMGTGDTAGWRLYCGLKQPYGGRQMGTEGAAGWTLHCGLKQLYWGGLMGTGGAAGWTLHYCLKPAYGGRTDGDRRCGLLDTPMWSKTAVCEKD